MDEPHVDIIDAVTGEIIDHCNGPAQGGGCPYAESDGIVPCSGRRIAAADAGPEHWHVWIPPGSSHCPQDWNLGSLGY